MQHNLSFFLLISTKARGVLLSLHRAIVINRWRVLIERRFHWKRIGAQNTYNYCCSRALRIIERDQRRRPTFMNNCHERGLSFADLFPMRDTPQFEESPCWEASKPLRGRLKQRKYWK